MVIAPNAVINPIPLLPPLLGNRYEIANSNKLMLP